MRNFANGPTLENAFMISGLVGFGSIYQTTLRFDPAAVRDGIGYPGSSRAAGIERANKLGWYQHVESIERASAFHFQGRGTYVVELWLPAGNESGVSITLDAPEAALLESAFIPFLNVGDNAEFVVASAMSRADGTLLTGAFYIDSERAGDPLRGVLRFHSIPVGSQAAGTWVRVLRVADSLS